MQEQDRRVLLISCLAVENVQPVDCDCLVPDGTEPFGGASGLPKPETQREKNQDRRQGACAMACQTFPPYKDQAIKVTKVGKSLGVKYVVEGSVHDSGEHTVLGGKELNQRKDVC